MNPSRMVIAEVDAPANFACSLPRPLRSTRLTTTDGKRQKERGMKGGEGGRKDGEVEVG